MDAKDKHTEAWFESTSQLVEAYRHLISIKLVEHTSLGASISLVGLMSLIIGIFLLLFVSLGAAWWFGEYLENMVAGFFLVGGVYTTLLAVLFFTRKIWVQKIRNIIIRTIYEQD